MGSGLELVGYQFQSSTPVSFSEQVGLYAIRQRDGSLQYVGLTGKAGLGKCLSQKTDGPLDARFYSFDFYGIRPVLEDGILGPLPDQTTVADAMAAMLSVMVEVAEPKRNSRLYNRFSTMEFTQWRDPKIEEELWVKDQLEQFQRGPRLEWIHRRRAPIPRY